MKGSGSKAARTRAAVGVTRTKATRKAVPRATLADKTGRRIAAAFSAKGGHWRTLGGVARETGLPEETVREYVRGKKACFVRAPVSPGGKELYGIKSGAVPAGEDDRRKAAAG